VIDPAACAAIREDLKWLADALGNARDLDVFLAETLPPMVRHLHEHEGLLELRDKARKAQSVAYKEAREAIGSQRYQRLMLSLGAWLEKAPTHVPDESAPDVQAIAQRMLSKRYKQLCRHGKRLTEMQEEERHAARIAAKKLRYAAEFFASLYPEKETRAFLRKLATLQNTLGELNDISVTDMLICRLAGPRPGRTLDEARHLFTGWNASDTAHHLNDMARDWKAFSRMKAFWL